MYKVIFIDIDGTLKDSNGHISNNTIAEIEKIKNMGIQVILCSGRNKEDAVKYSKQCKASGYVIIFDGAEVWDYENETPLFKLCLTKETVEELERLTKRLKLELIISADNLQADVLNKYAVLQCRIKLFKPDRIDEIRRSLQELDNIKINELMRKSNVITYDSNNADQIDFFISNGQANKWKAIEELCKIKGINRKDIIAIGDGSNDIEMLKNAGFGIAMGNATEEVKENADIMIPSNDKEGVAIFLKELRNRINLKNKSNEKGER